MQPGAVAPTLTCQADKLFTGEKRRALIDHPAGNLLAGDEIPGTGVRKLCLAVSGRTGVAVRG